MAGEDNYIEFEILGEDFKIKTDVPDDYFFRIIDYLKSKIGEAKKRFPNQSNIRALIFVALDLVDELFKTRERALNQGAIEKLAKLSEHLASVIDEVDKH